MQIQQIPRLLWRHKLVAVFVFLVLMGAAYAAIQIQDKEYESTTAIAVYPEGNSEEGFLPSADTYSLLVGTLAARVETDDGQILGRPVPGTVETSTEGGRSIVRITATAASPREAAETARAASEGFEAFARDNRFVTSQVIEPVNTPTSPSAPRPVLTLALAAVLGIGAAILAAMATERLRRRIETAADLSELIDAPVLAELPRERAVSRGAALTAWSDPKAFMFLEGIRSLRTTLEILGAADVVERTGRTVPQQLLFTSATAGQGKSTTVANLGIAFAQVGIETLIIDADLRQPQQHRIFGVDNSTGLTRPPTSDEENPYLAETQPTAYESLRILPAGPASAAAPDILQIRFRALMAEFRSHATIILVDSPPLLSVSDTRILAPHTTGVVLVTAARREKPQQIAAAVAQLRLVGESPLGMVLNAANLTFDDDYAYVRRSGVAAVYDPSA